MLHLNQTGEYKYHD